MQANVPPNKQVSTMSTTWYYYDNEGQKQGPVSGGRLKGLAKAGQINPNTIIETEDGKQARAEKVKGLTFIAPEAIPLESANPFTASMPVVAKPADSPFSATMPTASRAMRQSVSVPVAENERNLNNPRKLIFAGLGILLLAFVLIGGVFASPLRIVLFGIAAALFYSGGYKRTATTLAILFCGFVLIGIGIGISNFGDGSSGASRVNTSDTFALEREQLEQTIIAVRDFNAAILRSDRRNAEVAMLKFATTTVGCSYSLEYETGHKELREAMTACFAAMEPRYREYYQEKVQSYTNSANKFAKVLENERTRLQSGGK